jgi:hypothetical protein
VKLAHVTRADDQLDHLSVDGCESLCGYDELDPPVEVGKPGSIPPHLCGNCKQVADEDWPDGWEVAYVKVPVHRAVAAEVGTGPNGISPDGEIQADKEE